MIQPGSIFVNAAIERAAESYYLISAILLVSRLSGEMRTVR